MVKNILLPDLPGCCSPSRAGRDEEGRQQVAEQGLIQSPGSALPDDFPDLHLCRKLTTTTTSCFRSPPACRTADNGTEQETDYHGTRVTARRATHYADTDGTEENITRAGVSTRASTPP